jgi:hypothetical protein
MVFTPENIDTAVEDILFADSLGVADIRIISSAQYNQAIENLQALPQDVLDRHPILKYRVQNYLNCVPIRGLQIGDSPKCKLVLDDMAVAGGSGELYHYPCIIYLRQHGKPIGKVGNHMREEREVWYNTHDVLKDEICQRTCLDVCSMFNRRAEWCE